ncbi:MAG: hypothetical protein SFU25_05390 [Candidatus Caenarcaniphilales bacterium]|nr:hypothetical protein [Candidatus Caenarcaniphilales bacterium]
MIHNINSLSKRTFFHSSQVQAASTNTTSVQRAAETSLEVIDPVVLQGLIDSLQEFKNPQTIDVESLKNLTFSSRRADWLGWLNTTMNVLFVGLMGLSLAMGLRQSREVNRPEAVPITKPFDTELLSHDYELRLKGLIETLKSWQVPGNNIEGLANVTLNIIWLEKELKAIETKDIQFLSHRKEQKLNTELVKQIINGLERQVIEGYKNAALIDYENLLKVENCPFPAIDELKSMHTALEWLQQSDSKAIENGPEISQNIKAALNNLPFELLVLSPQELQNRFLNKGKPLPVLKFNPQIETEVFTNLMGEVEAIEEQIRARNLLENLV